MSSTSALVDRFQQAIRAEIAFIEKEGREQTFELTSGQRDSQSGPAGSLYVFLLADPMRLPEDASGSLRIEGKELPALVVAQEVNRIWILIENGDALPPYMPSAKLVLSQTALLKRLLDRLPEVNQGADMVAKLFGQAQAQVVSRELSPEFTGRGMTEAMRNALAHAVGSEITFVWGPPGTGKTFAIATLVAAFVRDAKSVLVTSHTHAAVEQALWELIKPEQAERLPGLLASSDLVRDGRILKVGRSPSEKIPKTCHLDSYFEEIARQRQSQIDELLVKQQSLDAERGEVLRELDPWDRLATALTRDAEAEAAFERINRNSRDRRAELTASLEALTLARTKATAAERSFFIGRGGRVRRAQEQIQSCAHRVELTEIASKLADRKLESEKEARADVAQFLNNARVATVGLRDEAFLRMRGEQVARERAAIANEINTLRNIGTDWADDLLNNALAVFATLTKLYVDAKLRPRKWDVVIVDEVSMAMPPLLAVAAAHAKSQVIIVGDFFQLPPIVQSREGIAKDELGTDIFVRRGIDEAARTADGHPQLVSLNFQRRMDPAIAEVARELAYRGRLLDHDDTLRRHKRDWLAADGMGALLVVDTTALRTWSGKLPGSLSRFNFYTAQVATEIAAAYARMLPKPEQASAPLIGIVTPYSAQRRYIARLVKEIGLERWVAVGTVHTFQGNECDTIIFDSVLAEPHWGARLTNPLEFPEVRRELNVAVTRARDRFVFVGDAAWLNRHASPGSGYGQLWSQLKDKAHHVDVLDLLEADLRGRTASSVANALGWSVDSLPRTTAMLDETSFYPAFAADLGAATDSAVLYTAYIGKTRWPLVEPHITGAAGRGVRVIVLHKPLRDPAWWDGDPAFGRAVLSALRAHGVQLVPISGIHAKTIVIDGQIVYDGSLNWASQTASYERMWRFESRDMAALVERMLQIDAVERLFDTTGTDTQTCPKCHGPLMLVNQREKANRSFVDPQPMKLACANYAEDKESCSGYLRRVSDRAPFTAPPRCERGSVMRIHYTTKGKPWDWRCSHIGCRRVRWLQGDLS